MIIIDLEWNRGYDKTPLEEILQIGAVRLDKLGGKIIDTFCVFIHPHVHKKLNRTAKLLPELQASLSSPYDFPTAMEAFLDWCGEDRIFADWGGDDFQILRQNCEFWKVPTPVPHQLLNLQLAFSLKVQTNQGLALFRAVEYCGIPTPFTFHNALNDAVYTAMVTAWLDHDTMALLELPKELRRLVHTPHFPSPPPRLTGPYRSMGSALNGRGCRRISCPLCENYIWVRQWFPAGENCYLADFRCKTHGSFLCRLTLTPNGEQWQGKVTIPEITPQLLAEFDIAIKQSAIPCRLPKHRKTSYHSRRSKRTAITS